MQRKTSIPAALAMVTLLLLVAIGGGIVNAQDRSGGEVTDPVAVHATVETEPVPNSGDAADDIAIWIDPNDPSRSVVIGTDKKGGLAVYDLTGAQLQYLEYGEMNNVDLRYGFELDGEEIPLITVTNRTGDAISIFTIDPESRELRDIAARTIEIGVREAYGLCMYHSPETGDYYVFVDDKKGQVEQWRLFDDGNSKVDAESVRMFDVGTQVEGCVADDELGSLYVAEEDVALWKYGAEPDSGEDRVSVDMTGQDGHLTADIEGLTIYYGADQAGYVIASSQGANTYAVYVRAGDTPYVGTFEIADGDTVDKTNDTDGIDVTNVPLGDAFPQGMFVAQDAKNDGGQNYKFVPWQEIADGLGLQSDTDWRPW